eukprot:758613-Pleurochrysis_carterae.AAC.1
MYRDDATRLVPSKSAEHPPQACTQASNPRALRLSRRGARLYCVTDNVRQRHVADGSRRAHLRSKRVGHTLMAHCCG